MKITSVNYSQLVCLHTKYKQNTFFFYKHSCKKNSISNMSDNKNRPLSPHRQELPCRPTDSELTTRTHRNYEDYYAFPRHCKFAYMTPGYYATGFRILDVYKTEVDYTEMRRLLFLEEPKWKSLKNRIPFSDTRVTNLPGTRNLHYNNYCLRSLTPESAMSWRKSILKPKPHYIDPDIEKKAKKFGLKC